MVRNKKGIISPRYVDFLASSKPFPSRTSLDELFLNVKSFKLVTNFKRNIFRKQSEHKGNKVLLEISDADKIKELHNSLKIDEKVALNYNSAWYMPYYSIVLVTNNDEEFEVELLSQIIRIQKLWSESADLVDHKKLKSFIKELGIEINQMVYHDLILKKFKKKDQVRIFPVIPVGKGSYFHFYEQWEKFNEDQYLY